MVSSAKAIVFVDLTRASTTNSLLHSLDASDNLIAVFCRLKCAETTPSGTKTWMNTEDLVP